VTFSSRALPLRDFPRGGQVPFIPSFAEFDALFDSALPHFSTLPPPPPSPAPDAARPGSRPSTPSSSTAARASAPVPPAAAGNRPTGVGGSQAAAAAAAAEAEASARATAEAAASDAAEKVVAGVLEGLPRPAFFYEAPAPAPPLPPPPPPAVVVSTPEEVAACSAGQQQQQLAAQGEAMASSSSAGDIVRARAFSETSEVFIPHQAPPYPTPFPSGVLTRASPVAALAATFWCAQACVYACAFRLAQCE